MKTIISVLVSMMAFASMASASDAGLLTKDSPHSYVGYMVKESGLAYSKSFDLDVSSYDGKQIGAIVVYTSATFSAGTFTDGQVSTGAITIISTTALAGQTITINGHAFTAGTDFVIDYPTTTATNLAALINKSGFTAGLITATAASTAVNLVSNAVLGNYTLASSAPTLMSIGGNMGGGTRAYYSAATDLMEIASHNLTTGLPVLYTASSGGAIGGLVANTTYYAIPADSSHVYLASSSVLAQAGTMIDLVGQNAPAAVHTYTLTPLAISGTPSFKWQESNDGASFVDVNISSVTMSAYTLGGAVSGFDFGDIFNFHTLRLNVTGPTAGGILLQAIVDVRN